MTSQTTGGSDQASCPCPQDGSAVSRRAVLRAGGAVGALALLASAAGSLVHTQVAYAAPSYTGDTLVVLSLRGGFDGLSAVAPVADPSYLAARPTIGIPASRAIQLDGRFGLHPALAALRPYYQAGTFGAVHAVGQLNPTRSHFAAMEDMEKAAPGSSLRTGWIDRMVGLAGFAQPLRRHRDGLDDRAELVHRPEPRGHHEVGRRVPALRGRQRSRPGALGRGDPRAVRRGTVHPGHARAGDAGTARYDGTAQGDAVHARPRVRPIPRVTSATRCATWPG